MRDERFVEDLLCELSDADLVERGAWLVDKLAERDDVRARLKETQQQAKADLEYIDEGVSRLAKEIRAQVAIRPVECIERANYEIDQVETVRLDTSLVIRHRAFEHDERQLSLEPRKAEMPEPLEDSDQAWEESAKQGVAAV